ncbi:unnamed protein product [Clonostachys chloroleuca]|uniref:F-box domain-containing protein n=1 Tax=Clonostachys chloroleuca TaxID=1926264 RepID=A0AA35M955_9HYPO|nr:unnamed protein product [Clonostachys chloroleuca]
MLHLPNEILEAIASWLETQRDIYALVRTSRQLRDALNSTLYRRNVEDSGGSALTWAVDYRREETAIKAIRAGAPGGEALWCSVFHKDEKMVKLILSEMRRGNDDAYKVLDRAIERGHAPVVKLLMEYAGIAADSPVMRNSLGVQGQTPLCRALYWQQEPVIEMMMSLGEIDINARGYMRGTPFTMAAALGLAATIKLFLDSGKVDAGSYADDNSSALMLAISRSHDDIAKMLLVQDGVDVNHANNYGHRALSLAAEQGLLDVVKTLIGMENVDVDFKDRYGCTPLAYASSEGYLSIVELLLDSGGVDPDSRTVWGETPFILASSNGHIAVMRCLVDTGKIDVWARCDDDTTAFSSALDLGDLSVLELIMKLQESTFDERSVEDYRKTLARAVYAQRLPIIELLLHSGLIDINEVDERGRTALHHACGLHAEEVVEYLLQREGINANVGDDKGFTPLMLAAASSLGLPTVKILLQSGKVDIDLQSNDGFMQYRSRPTWASIIQ